MFGINLLWMYMTMIFVILSVILTISFLKGRPNESKSEQYFSLVMILAVVLIAITLIAIGYPYSNRVFAYNSIQSRESMWVVLYGFIIVIIGLVVSIIFVRKPKKGKLIK